MTIIELDGASKEDFSILVGKDVLLKFTQETPLLERSRTLKKLVTASRDLLQDQTKLDAINKLVDTTASIRKNLHESIRRRDSIMYVDEGDKSAILEVYKRRFARIKESIKNDSQTIGKTEEALGLFIATTQELYFCQECEAYLGPMDEMLPNSCQACGATTNPKPGKKSSNFRFLSEEIQDYLAGKWIQDYSANLFRGSGWKTWTECMIMGTSGVKHQIDLLAVHEEKGRVLIAECKTRAVSDDAFRLITQFSDIQPSFGLLISLKEMGECDGKNLIHKKPGLKLIELLSKSDAEAKETIVKYVSSDN